MSSDNHNGHDNQSEVDTTRMSSDATKEDVKASHQGSSEVNYAEADILAELRDLGSHLVAAVQAIGQSEQVRTLQRDLTSGLRNAAEQVQGAAQNVGETDVVKGVKEQASKVTEHPVVRDIQTGIAQALRELNKRLESFAESTRSKTENQSEEAAQLALPGEVGDIVEPDTDKPTTKLND
jgi:hypothetical protein